MALRKLTLVWVVVGSVLAFLFLVSCVISVVKAIRDRQRIKARKKAKRAALTNGQVPENSRKPRANIIFIPDMEKEQRMKRWRRRVSFGTSSFSLALPDSLRSLRDFGPSSVEITTAAEVVVPSADVTCISGGVVDDGVRVDSQVLSDASYLLDKHHGHLSGVNVSADAGTEVVAFQGSSLTGGGEVSAGGGGRLVSAFPVPVSSDVDSAPFSDPCESGNAYGDRPQRQSNGVKAKVKPTCTVPQHNAHSQQLRAISMSSNGFFGTANAKVCRRELRSAGFNPRRNSYAAGLSSAVCTDVPPKRRHSDECRRVISDSVSRLYHNAMRSRRFERGGTDNPAYETLDDEGILWKEMYPKPFEGTDNE